MYGDQRGKGEGGINQEFGINTYTLLYVNQASSKDLLYSTENSNEYLVITYKGRECIHTHTYVTEYCHFNAVEKIRKLRALRRKTQSHQNSLAVPRVMLLGCTFRNANPVCYSEGKGKNILNKTAVKLLLVKPRGERDQS